MSETDDEAFEGLVDQFDEPVTVILTQRSDHWLPEIDVAGTEDGDEAILAVAKALFIMLNDAVNGPYEEEGDDEDPDWVDE